MIARPVADFLVQMDLGDAEPTALFIPTEADLTPAWPEEEREEDASALIDAAREEGYAAGVEAANAEHAAQNALAREQFDAELAAARETWTHKEGERLREQLSAAMQAMEETFADALGRVLQPFVIATLRQQMIDRLIEGVRTVAGNAEKIAIQISGPADLLDILRQHLDTSPAAIEYITLDTVDVRVVTGQTSIDTQLKAWIDLIAAEG
jgi:hypothetical protein